MTSTAANADAIKEELGYLKVVFGILLITDFSLIGWFFTNVADLATVLKLVSAVSAIVLSGILFRIHRRIARLLKDLWRI